MLVPWPLPAMSTLLKSWWYIPFYHPWTIRSS